MEALIGLQDVKEEHREQCMGGSLKSLVRCRSLGVDAVLEYRFPNGDR